MANFLPDEIVMNIVARLPTKPFLRFRCVSKYWNRVLHEASIMKLRSRKMMILPVNETFHLIDDKLPIEDKSNSSLKRCFPNFDKFCTIVGSFNGIVLLAYMHTMILYNPLTGASKKLPDPPSHYYDECGFGYGEDPDDLKIFWFRVEDDICDVYSFKRSSWSPWITSQYKIKFLVFRQKVGQFLNGFLHWMTYRKTMVAFLNVKDMVVSYLRPPFENGGQRAILGTTGGCLCTLIQVSRDACQIYVMKEHGNEDSWMSTYLITLDLERYRDWRLLPTSILDNGKIVMGAIPSTLENGMETLQLISCNPLNNSYKEMNIQLLRGGCYRTMNIVDYVESLLSPSDMCTFQRKTSYE